MKVFQHLWFEKDMEAAVRFYTGLVPGSVIRWTSAVAADNPSGSAGAVKIIAFTLGDQDYHALQAGPLDPFNRSFSIVVECDDQTEVDRLWAALLDGGKASQCGWLTDRWGLSWQIVPKRLGELMNGGDGASARRVAEAMLKMVKFDIAALEAAAAG
jgi:predicted 3-demethylubiquinone-9 3-methyltransferase (glyoxalase superfamily)